MSRVISGLIWARAVPRPSCIPKGRARGKKAAGLRYERELARALPQAQHGMWFEFEDRAGHGYCQTDLVLPCSEGLVVLEAKYTWTEAGHHQLERLYRPVVEMALGRRALGVMVCRTLLPEMGQDSVCRTLAAAIGSAAQGRRTVLHWVGAGLSPFQPSPPPRPLASGLHLL